MEELDVGRNRRYRLRPSPCHRRQAEERHLQGNARRGPEVGPDARQVRRGGREEDLRRTRSAGPGQVGQDSRWPSTPTTSATIGERDGREHGKSLRKRAGAALTTGLSDLKSRVVGIREKLSSEWEKTGGKWAEGVGRGLKKNLSGILIGAISLAIISLAERPGLRRCCGGRTGVHDHHSPVHDRSSGSRCGTDGRGRLRHDQAHGRADRAGPEAADACPGRLPEAPGRHEDPDRHADPGRAAVRLQRRDPDLRSRSSPG
jgi:hypothetical protein